MSSISPDFAFHRLFDHMPEVSFFAKDSDYNFVAASRRFYERFGFTEERHLIGKNDFDIFPTRLAENFRQDDMLVMSTGQPKLNIMELFFTQQGIPDWFVTNKLPILDREGRTIGVMGSVQSYEGRKQVMQPYLQLDKAVNYIRQHFRSGVTISELAELVHLSPRQLHRKFVETFGSSPQAFIMKLRIQAACEALQHEDRQISEVAMEMGFCDQSSFTQQFQKHVGLTPMRYQRQFRMRAG
ncbi:MAG TPA: AraC family transcriptional regulator [Verrucomicrobium sp.]|nr:AraC family transcriptional regulator [Verrucomicrobium sp.]